MNYFTQLHWLPQLICFPMLKLTIFSPSFRRAFTFYYTRHIMERFISHVHYEQPLKIRNRFKINRKSNIICFVDNLTWKFYLFLNEESLEYAWPGWSGKGSIDMRTLVTASFFLKHEVLEISPRQKCVIQMEISNSKISCTVNGERRSFERYCG